MKAILVAGLLMLASAGAANAVCYGSGSFRNCFDSNGNSYTVQRFGNQTIVNGSNAQTGSVWSQQSNTFGNSTYTTGQTNGRTWNETQTQFGNGTQSIYGTDSNGNPFSKFCTKLGCF